MNLTSEDWNRLPLARAIHESAVDIARSLDLAARAIMAGTAGAAESPVDDERRVIR